MIDKDISNLRFVRSKIKFENIALFIFIIVFFASRQLSGYNYGTFLKGVFFLGMAFLVIQTYVGMALYPLSAIFSFFLPTNVFFIPVALTTFYQFAVVFFFGLYVFFLKKLKKIHNPANIFMLALTIIFFILTVYHGQQLNMDNTVLVHFLEGALIYFTIVYFLSEKKKMRFFLYALIFTGFTIAVRFFTFGSFEASLRGFENNAISRVFIFLIVPAIFLFFAEKSWQPKIIALAVSGFLLHSLIFLGSRGTYIAGAAMFLLIALRNIHKPKIWVAFAAGALFFSAIAPQLFWDEWNSIRYASGGVESEDPSIAGRFFAAESGLDMLKKNLITGVGIGNFQYKMREYTGGARLNAHNAYIEMAAEQGIFGIFFYLALFVISFWNLFRAIRNFRNKNQFFYNMSLGIQLGLVGLAINQSFINGPWDSIVFIAFGLSTALYVISQKELKNVTKLTKEQIAPIPKEALQQS